MRDHFPRSKSRMALLHSSPRKKKKIGRTTWFLWESSWAILSRERPPGKTALHGSGQAAGRRLCIEQVHPNGVSRFLCSTEKISLGGGRTSQAQTARGKSKTER